MLPSRFTRMTAFRAGGFFVTPLIGLLSLACTPAAGGQSGSEGAYALPCPCTLATAKTPLRAELTAVAEGCVVLEVLEVLDSDADPELTPGSVVGGPSDGTPACQSAALPLAQGTQVLAYYARGADDGGDCVEYRECSEQRCGPVPTDDSDAMAAWDSCDEACLAETQQACAAHEEQAWLNGHVALVRWEEPLDFGDYGSLPRDELAVLELESDSECTSRFATPVTEKPSTSDSSDQAPPDDPATGGFEDGSDPLCPPLNR